MKYELQNLAKSIDQKLVSRLRYLDQPDLVAMGRVGSTTRQDLKFCSDIDIVIVLEQKRPESAQAIADVLSRDFDVQIQPQFFPYLGRQRCKATLDILFLGKGSRFYAHDYLGRLVGLTMFKDYTPLIGGQLANYVQAPGEPSTRKDRIEVFRHSWHGLYDSMAFLFPTIVNESVCLNLEKMTFHAIRNFFWCESGEFDYGLALESYGSLKYVARCLFAIQKHRDGLQSYKEAGQAVYQMFECMAQDLRVKVKGGDQSKPENSSV
ncbi:MAG: hypothetical protein KDC35_20755 [Acidobacteria bacterium]|nr:hypothetical protein [Acidobacteriota bacterium]